MNLYKVAENHRKILEEIYNCEGEISPSQMTELMQTGQSLDDKAVSIAAFILNLKADRDSIDKAIDNMKQRAKKLDNKIESLENYLKENLISCQVNHIKSAEFDIKIKQNPASVHLYDETLVPDNYKKEKVMISISLSEILMDLKLNKTIPGAQITHKTRLEIK